MAEIYHVNPNDVEVRDWTFYKDIAYQKTRLEDEGQIEPLVAYRINPIESTEPVWAIDNSDWPYACAQVIAARELEWPTILITDDHTGGD